MASWSMTDFQNKVNHFLRTLHENGAEVVKIEYNTATVGRDVLYSAMISFKREG